MNGIKKIIIRFPNWLGDCVMAAPMLDVLREKYPECVLHILVRGGLAELFRNDPRVANVYSINDKSGILPVFSYFSIARKLSLENYDLGLILPKSFSSMFTLYMAGIPKRISYPGDADFMLSEVVTPPQKLIHRSLKYINLIEPLKSGDADLHFPRLYSNQDMKNRARQLIGDFKQYVIIAPQSRATSRRWGYDKYSQLAARISNELKMKIVFLGAADEIDIVENVGKQSGIEYLNLAGKSSLMVSFEIMKKAAAYVGNDSGGAHLAAASGTYTISISGADNPDETRPLARRGKVIRKPLPCSPCVMNYCPRDDFPNECMHIISVNDVFEAVSEAANAK
jgi:heptosyltransferase-2